MRAVIILTILVSLLCTWSAPAASIVTELRPDNVRNQRLGFQINARKDADKVTFIIVISPKDSQLSEVTEAQLALFDGSMEVASCAPEKVKRDESVLYTFTVAEKYLARSKFTFWNMATVNGQPMPAGDAYWFYLSEFVSREGGSDQNAKPQPMAKRLLTMEMPGGRGTVSLTEQSNSLMLGVPIASTASGKTLPAHDEVIRDLGLKVWLLKSDGSAVLPRNGPSPVRMGNGLGRGLTSIYLFPKVSSEELAGVVLRVNGQLYCAAINPH